MESSLSSSQSEPTMSKNIFKKPAAKTKAAFDVSLNSSSIIESQSNKSDVDLDSTTLGKKAAPFKKVKKPMQQFNVTLEESAVESDSDKTIAHQKVMFRPKNQPQVDLFNVSYNESKLTSTQVDTIVESSVSIDEDSITVQHNKSNPFRRSRRIQKENLLPEHNQMEVSTADETSIVNKSNNQTNLTVDSSDSNLSSFTDRKNLFKRKKRVANVENLMEVSSVVDDEDKTGVTKTDIFKPSLFKKRNTEEQMMEVSSTNEISIERNHTANESFAPQEAEISGFRTRSRLSVKDQSSVDTSQNNANENLTNSLDIRETLANISKKSNRLSRKEPSTPVFNTSSSKNSSNLSQVTDLNSSRSSRMSGKKSSSKEQELENIESQNNSNVSQKSKRSSFRESLKKNESLLSMSNTDQIMRRSRSSANSLRDDTEKNRNLSTTETTKRNLSIDKNLSKMTNNSMMSGMTFDQSSYNDDNLNNWMSDQSDHSDVEDPPIAIPSIPPIPTEEEYQKETTEKSGSDEGINTKMSWAEKFKEIVSQTKKPDIIQVEKKSSLEKPEKKAKSKPSPNKVKYRPPKLRKPAHFATKYLYNFIIKKLEPKYGIDCIIEAEELITSICDTVKMVVRKKDYQRKLVKDLKKEMAEAGVINTTLDFYEFVIKFLPYNFRVKVVPCFQPATNTVYPPKDTENPFDKIL